MVGTVNEQKIRGMKPGGGKLTESLPGRGMGSLIFKRQSESPPMAFYRYRLEGLLNQDWGLQAKRTRCWSDSTRDQRAGARIGKSRGRPW